MYFKYDIHPHSITTKGGNNLNYITLKVWSKTDIKQKVWKVAFTKSFNTEFEDAEDKMFEFVNEVRKTYKIIPFPKLT